MHEKFSLEYYGWKQFQTIHMSLYQNVSVRCRIQNIVRLFANRFHIHDVWLTCFRVLLVLAILILGLWSWNICLPLHSRNFCSLVNNGYFAQATEVMHTCWNLVGGLGWLQVRNVAIQSRSNLKTSCLFWTFGVCLVCTIRWYCIVRWIKFFNLFPFFPKSIKIKPILVDWFSRQLVYYESSTLLGFRYITTGEKKELHFSVHMPHEMIHFLWLRLWSLES